MSIFLEVCNNKIIVCSVLSWAVAQIIKICIDLAQTRKIDIRLITSSGGMPSSHTSFIVAMAGSVGFTEGFDSVLFAVCFVLSAIVMYDAAGVRRAAGRQAAVLNLLLKKLEKEGLRIDERLKELLGHSPIEVAMGALLGGLIAFLFYK